MGTAIAVPRFDGDQLPIAATMSQRPLTFFQTFLALSKG
jgi:hypothetical protein